MLNLHPMDENYTRLRSLLRVAPKSPGKISFTEHPFALCLDGEPAGRYFSNMCIAADTARQLNPNGSDRYTVKHLQWGVEWNAQQCRTFASDTKMFAGGVLYTEWANAEIALAATRGTLRLN